MFNLPTGVGKSILSQALLILLQHYRIINLNQNKAVVITHRNRLFEQYTKDFRYMYPIKGKANYTCSVDFQKLNQNTPCISQKSFSNCSEREFCNYYKTIQNILKSKILITNYNWYLYNSSSHYSSSFKYFVFDEVHKINEIIDEIFHISLDNVKLDLVNIRDAIKSEIMIEHAIDARIFKLISADINALIDEVSMNEDLAYEMVNEYIDKLLKLKEKIGLLEIVDQYDISGKDIIADNRKIMENLTKNTSPGSVNVFMSATMSKDYFCKYLYNKNPEDLLYIEREPIFEQKNRMIYVPKGMPSLNYENMNDDNFIINTWIPIIDIFIESYPDVKGFIYVASYKQANLIQLHSKHKERLLVNRSPSDFNKILNLFIEDETNKVLVSAVTVEGYDFAGDISRFQIITKIPFPPVNDPLNEKYGLEWYFHKTVNKLIQVVGRSIRNMEDYADTIILDGSIERLTTYLPKWFVDSMRS